MLLLLSAAREGIDFGFSRRLLALSEHRRVVAHFGQPATGSTPWMKAIRERQGGWRMAVSAPKDKRSVANARPPYTSRIIKAGALLSDTKTLLAQWDVSAPAAANIERLRRENVFGKASRSRVEDILAIFRQRFLTDESVTRALIVLVRQRFAAPSLDRVLFFHAARADQLLHDIVTEVLLPLRARGITDIDTIELQRPLKKWVANGKTSGDWSDPTITRIAQGLLSTLRDFGVLQGAAKKRISPAYLPIGAFAYLAFYFKQHHPSGAKLVELPDWNLFFLSREGVERLLFEGHQNGLLEYHAAGSVTRLTFPATTLEEYAHVLTQTAH